MEAWRGVETHTRRVARAGPSLLSVGGEWINSRRFSLLKTVRSLVFYPVDALGWRVLSFLAAALFGVTYAWPITWRLQEETRDEIRLSVRVVDFARVSRRPCLPERPG